MGLLLLVVGLLTLLNAPFDWASLGLTRALLRRGLELGGWWPCLLALVDALAAAFIVALLAFGLMPVGMSALQNGTKTSAPLDVKPGSINCEDVAYPYSTSSLPITLYGQDLRISYMDVPPMGQANAAEAYTSTKLRDDCSAVVTGVTRTVSSWPFR